MQMDRPRQQITDYKCQKSIPLQPHEL
uniref:Uncharacterized protein n=1 Tax=Anguilla anguilla TaxID=7936 RepID=A0A0E9S6D6_ANGAN